VNIKISPGIPSRIWRMFITCKIKLLTKSNCWQDSPWCIKAKNSACPGSCDWDSWRTGNTTNSWFSW
jgi:hypothetical protein